MGVTTAAAIAQKTNGVRIVILISGLEKRLKIATDCGNASPLSTVCGARGTVRIFWSGRASDYSTRGSPVNQPTPELKTWPQRQHRRIAFRRRIDVQIADWPILEARCRDVSVGGIGVLLPRPVGHGDRLMFAIHQPDGGYTIVAAEVRWVREIDVSGEWEAGLRWIALKAPALAALELTVGPLRSPLPTDSL